MKDFVKPGIYKHYKGKLYEVIGICHHTETLEKLVIYKALYNCDQFGNEPLWVRPVTMFMQDVEYGGHTVERFSFQSPV